MFLSVRWRTGKLFEVLTSVQPDLCSDLWTGTNQYHCSTSRYSFYFQSYCWTIAIPSGPENPLAEPQNSCQDMFSLCLNWFSIKAAQYGLKVVQPLSIANPILLVGHNLGWLLFSSVQIHPFNILSWISVSDIFGLFLTYNIELPWKVTFLC